MGRRFVDGIAHLEHDPEVANLSQLVSRELLRRDAANDYPLGFHTRKMSADYNATWADFVRIGASGLQVTLPQIRTADDLGRRVVVGNLGSYTTTVAARAGQLIEDAATYSHAGFGFKQFIVADDAQWITGQMPAGSINVGGASEAWAYLTSSNPSTVSAIPSALFQFDGTGSALSNRMGGSGLTEFGTARGYGAIGGLVGKRSDQAGGTNGLYGANGDTNVITNGALTVELLWATDDTSPTGTAYMAGVGESGSIAGQDVCWALGRTLSVEQFQYLHQSTGPVNRSWNPPVYVAPRMQLLTMTRNAAGTGVAIYIDGNLMASTTLAAAPGSTSSGRLWVGALDNATPLQGMLAFCLRITKAEFTAAEVLEGYQQARGIA